MKATKKPVQPLDLHVAAYLRVSTEEQAESGLGLDAQETKVRAMATVKGWPEPTLYIDAGITGTIDIDKRPEGERLLNDIHSGKVNAVIVLSLDRIGRRAKFILNFADSTKDSITLVSCKESFDTSTAQGRFVLGLFALMAEWERDNTSERTIAALGARGDRHGIKAGIPPYGYRYDTTIVKVGKYIKRDFHGVVINEQEADIVRYVYLLRGQKLTLRAIAEKVEQDKKVHIGFNTVKNILDREDVYLGGKRGESEHTWPIILNAA